VGTKETPPILTVTDAPDSKAEEVIEEGLAQYNENNAGYRDSRPLAVLVSDPDTKAVVGGLMIATFYTLFFVPVTYSLLRRKPPKDFDHEGDK